MEGFQQVMLRIGEIQQKIKSFQPQRVQYFQDFSSRLHAKSFKNVMNETLKKDDLNVSQTIQKNNVIKNNVIKIETPISRSSINSIIHEASKKYNVPIKLIKAVIKQESAFNPKAISRAGARGLMQLMPQTAKSYGVTDIFDPKQNVFAGTKHLKGLLNYFKGDLSRSLAAYNAGLSRVIRAKGIPNIRETKNYVKNVIHYYQKAKNLK